MSYSPIHCGEWGAYCGEPGAYCGGIRYGAPLADLSRYPVDMAIITLDYCNNTIGTSPCAAMDWCGKPGVYSGLSSTYCGGIQVRCYNTYATCKDKTNYSKGTKDYVITSNNAPLPFRTGERPYIKDIKHLPTEIKTSLTVAGRVSITVYDEPDTDIGIDPYVTTRDSVQGSFWKKLLARNPNYAGRPIQLYHGFYGLSRAEFIQKFEGTIDSITVKTGGAVTIECVDLLKTLSKIEIPPKLDIKLVADVAISQWAISLSDGTGLDIDNGYVRIGDEIIQYANLVGDQIYPCLRGRFGTTAATHSEGNKVQKCRYYEPQSPYDILVDILKTDAGIDPSYVNDSAYTALKAFDVSMVDFSALISEPTKLDTLYFEIIDLIDCKSWMGEDLKITIAKNLPNYPGRAYQVFTDAENIIADSDSVDLHATSRKSRVSIYWDKTLTGKLDEASSYARLDVAVDADGESANMYNDSLEKKIMCRWLRSDYMDEDSVIRYVANLSKRILRLLKNPQPIYTFAVELKDSQVKTGDFVRITTDKMLDVDGNPLSRNVYQIVKREPKGNKIALKAMKFPAKLIFYVGADTLPDFTDASEAEKESGFITDANGQMSDYSEGYVLY